MTRLLRGFVLVAVLCLLGIVGEAASAQVVPTPVPRPSYVARPVPAPASVQASHGSVYFLRGLLNVFSRGMDRLSAKLEARGVSSRVTNYTHWQEFATLLASQYRTDKSLAPVVIVGHSLGADAAVNMGNYLGRNGVPVRLIVAFDGVDGGSPVGAGISEVINYYKPDGYGRIIKASPQFTGKLENIDLSDKPNIDHLNIDKMTDLHDEVIAKVLSILGKQ